MPGRWDTSTKRLVNTRPEDFIRWLIPDTDSFVIYLKRCKVTEPFFQWTFPPTRAVHDFRFHVVKLWEIPVEELEQTGSLGLLPLMVLAKGGKQRKVVEKAIEAIETTEDEDKRDLLSLTYIFASLALVKETDRNWLQRRFRMFEDALKDSWAYQEIWQGGKQEGKQEEWLENLQRQRHMLEYVVEMKFPSLMPLAKKRGEVGDNPDVLQNTILRLLRAGGEQEAKRILSQEG